MTPDPLACWEHISTQQNSNLYSINPTWHAKNLQATTQNTNVPVVTINY